MSAASRLAQLRREAAQAEAEAQRLAQQLAELSDDGDGDGGGGGGGGGDAESSASSEPWAPAGQADFIDQGLALLAGGGGGAAAQAGLSLLAGGAGGAAEQGLALLDGGGGAAGAAAGPAGRRPKKEKKKGDKAGGCRWVDQQSLMRMYMDRAEAALDADGPAAPAPAPARVGVRVGHVRDLSVYGGVPALAAHQRYVAWACHGLTASALCPDLAEALHAAGAGPGVAPRRRRLIAGYAEKLGKWTAKKAGRCPQSLELTELLGVLKREGRLDLICWCRSEPADAAPYCHADEIRLRLEALRGGTGALALSASAAVQKEAARERRGRTEAKRPRPAEEFELERDFGAVESWSDLPAVQLPWLAAKTEAPPPAPPPKHRRRAAPAAAAEC